MLQFGILKLVKLCSWTERFFFRFFEFMACTELLRDNVPEFCQENIGVHAVTYENNL